MMNCLSLLSYITVFLLLSFQGYAQDQPITVAVLEQAYKDKIPYPQEISTGGQYKTGGSFHVEGTPFLVSSKFVEGQVTINGEHFDHVLLNYDVLNDQLITYHPRNYQQIILDNEKVQCFQLGNKRKFMQLDRNPGYFWHNNGYYELLWDDQITIFSKHYKVEEIKKNYGSSDKSFEFENHENFFIKTTEGLHRITRKKDITETMGIPKKQVNRIIRKEGLRFKKQRREALLAIAAFYTSELPND